MKRKWLYVLIVIGAIILSITTTTTTVHADEDSGQLNIDINRINEDKTKIDSTENNISETEDLFTHESDQLEKYMKQTEKKEEYSTLNALFQKDFMKQDDNLRTDQLFQEKISMSNIQLEEEKTESQLNRWLFITILLIIIVILCFGIFRLQKKLNVGESNE